MLSNLTQFVFGWSVGKVPSQVGKTAVVTGANSGIGYHTALQLGLCGVHVILACRDVNRGEDALATLRKQAPAASFELMLLDLGSFDSVRRFVATLQATKPTLDILVNNAGVMMIPTRQLSGDGFEMQTQSNHLGHFLLTGLLLPLLLRSSAPRVVNVSSLMHYSGERTTEFKYDARYDATQVYANTKLMNLLFSLELSRRHPKLLVVTAHPGGSSTNLQQHKFGNAKWIMQSAEAGALPSIRAALDPSVSTNDFYGPRFAMWGAPVKCWRSGASSDASAAGALWAASESATGIQY